MHGNPIIPSDRRFDADHTARLCQSCMSSMTHDDLEAEREHEDCLCRDCRSVRDELDLDEGWSTYLASLKPHAVRLVEELDNRLAGWKCLGGSMTFEQDAKGRRSVATAKDFRFVAPDAQALAFCGFRLVATAKDFRFVAPGHKVEAVFGLEGVTLRSASQHHALPEWSVSFSFETPLPVILAACVAAVTTE